MTVWKFEGVYKADAQKVADEIAAIGEDVSPAQIVERARDESTELHKCFEWDDSIAAERWRLHQARQIVCQLVYKEMEPDKSKMEQLRVMYKTGSGGYKPTTLILQKKDEYTALLRRAISELKAFERKNRMLVELDGVFEAIDQLDG